MHHKLIIRHLSGSKINQSDEYILADSKELSFGRDDGVDVQYNPEQDDLVSRRHAVIQRDDNDRFSIKDEGSRNGTFVNKQRISETFPLSHGDIVQFGPGGPEFRFELDPPPKSPPPLTRDASQYRPSRPTREVAAAGVRSDNIGSFDSYQPKGRFTLLQDSFNAYREKTLRTQISIGAGLLGLLILVAGLSYHLVTTSERKIEDAIAQETQAQYEKIQSLGAKVGDIEKETTSLMSPQEIADAYSKAVVLIELDWKLTHKETNKQVYHRHITVKDYEAHPAYLQIGDKIVPWLITDDEQDTNIPIGGSGKGTGFSVSSFGTILTNRHVAAGATTEWTEPYMQRRSLIYPVVDVGDETRSVYIVNTENAVAVDGQKLLALLQNLHWVPEREQYLTEKREIRQEEYFYLTPAEFTSRDTLNVYFPGDPNPMPGRLVRKSLKHDVALITVDSPGVLPTVTLEEGDTEPPLGEAVTILGYPGVSQDVVGMTTTVNPFDRQPALTTIYNPTLTTGHLGKRVAPNLEFSDPAITALTTDDYYQLTANATGAGNSGGPVFNPQGRVTGIFFAGREIGGARVTLAIPIKYGRELVAGYQSVVD